MADLKLKKLGLTQIFEISSLAKTGLVTHGISTRLGGFGESPYDSLNLALHVGDRAETVIANRSLICRELGSDIISMVTAEQVHGANVEVVSQAHLGRGALSYHTALPETDGLVTNTPGVMLATFYADCVPVLILDPQKRVIATAHAGWKGTAARIAAFTVKKMTEAFGTDPADCLAGIGPSIGPCCFEIGEPVIRTFQQEFTWWQDVMKDTGAGKARLDLWTANRRILEEAGVLPENIELTEVCTRCRQDILFSHRGSGGVTGRMGAFIMLRPIGSSKED